MKNPNWTKQANPPAGRRDAGRAPESKAAANPVTEDELEAYRFRGVPIRQRRALVGEGAAAVNQNPREPNEPALRSVCEGDERGQQ